MDIHEIQEYLTEPCLVMRYDRLKGMTEKQLMRKKNVILLMNIHNSVGKVEEAIGHFIALIQHHGYVEHFDSYGISMDQELALTHSEPYLSNILSNVKEDKYQLQQMRDDVQTCAQHCIARINFGKKFNDYRKFLLSLKTTPDEAVQLMCKFKRGSHSSQSS